MSKKRKKEDCPRCNGWTIGTATGMWIKFRETVSGICLICGYDHFDDIYVDEKTLYELEHRHDGRD